MVVDKNVMEDFDGMELNLMQENFIEVLYEIELFVFEEIIEMLIGVIYDNLDFFVDSDLDNDVEVFSFDFFEEIDDFDIDDYLLDFFDESESNVFKEEIFFV